MGPRNSNINEGNEEDKVVFEVVHIGWPPLTNTARMANFVHLSLSFSFVWQGLLQVFSSKHRKWEYPFCYFLYVVRRNRAVETFLCFIRHCATGYYEVIILKDGHQVDSHQKGVMKNNHLEGMQPGLQ